MHALPSARRAPRARDDPNRPSAWTSPRQRRSARARAGRLLAGLLLTQALLLLGFWLTRHGGSDPLGGLRRWFWLGGECQLHALFTTGQALLTARLAWGLHRREAGWAWPAAAAVCAFIGVDEALSLHEAVGQWLRTGPALPTNAQHALVLGGGVHVFAWQLVFMPLAALVGLALGWALWRVVSLAELVGLVGAAALFLAGALGFEAVQARGQSLVAGWGGSLAAHLNLLLEEACEATGMTLAAVVLAHRLWLKPPAA